MDAYLRRLQRAIDSAIAGMTDADFERHPEGKWCASEVLEHLYLTYTGTIKGLEKCLQEGKPLARKSATLRERIGKAVVVGVGYMPGGRQAPERARPRGTPIAQLRSDLPAKIAAMDELIGECESRFGKRTRLLDHPFFGPMTGKQWRKFHWVHGWHHVKQIRGLRAA